MPAKFPLLALSVLLVLDIILLLAAGEGFTAQLWPSIIGIALAMGQFILAAPLLRGRWAVVLSAVLLLAGWLSNLVAALIAGVEATAINPLGLLAISGVLVGAVAVGAEWLDRDVHQTHGFLLAGVHTAIVVVALLASPLVALVGVPVAAAQLIIADEWPRSGPRIASALGGVIALVGYALAAWLIWLVPIGVVVTVVAGLWERTARAPQAVQGD